MIKRDYVDKGVSLSGIGGVETGADAAEFILLGSDTVQVCNDTLWLVHGVQVSVCTGLQGAVLAWLGVRECRLWVGVQIVNVGSQKCILLGSDTVSVYGRMNDTLRVGCARLRSLVGCAECKFLEGTSVCKCACMHRGIGPC